MLLTQPVLTVCVYYVKFYFVMSEEQTSQDLLSSLLELAEQDLTTDTSKPKKLVEVDLFASNNPPDPSSSVAGTEADLLHEEQDEYCENRDYNNSGRDIKYLLETSSSTSSKQLNLTTNKLTTTWKCPPKAAKPSTSTPATIHNSDVYADPIFGIRIIKPLVSSTVLKERMVGRQAVHMSQIKKFVQREKVDVDWVVGGVIVNKQIRTSSNGNQYCIWTLSDLHMDLKTVGLFLFGSAYKEFWKTVVGTVIGVLNPAVLENKATSKDEVSIAVSFIVI